MNEPNLANRDKQNWIRNLNELNKNFKYEKCSVVDVRIFIYNLSDSE